MSTERKIERVCELIVDTLTLVAIHDPDKVSVERTNGEGNATHLTVTATTDDLPFLLGGRGSNVTSIGELANIASPGGHWINCYVKSREVTTGYRREPIDIPLTTHVDTDRAQEFLRIIADWHEEMTDQRPNVDLQQAGVCDCYLVDTRSLPGHALGSLRRIVGWASKCNGRIGFIEWIPRKR